MKRSLILLIFCLFVFSGWEIFSRTHPEFILFLPPPSLIAARLWQAADRFGFHTWITFQEMFLGVIFALALAFPLAWTMDRSRTACSLLQPLFVALKSVPLFTLAPLLVMWFGWSRSVIIVPTTLMLLFPLTITLYQGFRSTSQELIDDFRLHGATVWQMFSKLKLPSALPHLFGGLRLATAIAGTAAIAGEWVGAQNGLGTLILESRRDMDLETSFAALFCLAGLSGSFYSIVIVAEKLSVTRSRLFQWKPLAMATGVACLVLTIWNGQAKTETPVKSVELLLDWLPNPNHVPLYTGVAKGFFLEEGIDLNVHKLADAIHASSCLLAGQGDLVVSYMPHTLRLLRKGAPVEVVGILIKEPLNSIIYRADKGIENVADLKGKTIGSAGEASTLHHLLKINRIVPKETIKVGFDLVAGLGADQVDAIYPVFWNIESEHLNSLGIPVQVFHLCDLGMPNYCELIILAKSGTACAETGFVTRFKRALQKSIDYAIQHPDEAFACYTATQIDRSDKTQHWEKKAWIKTLPLLANKQETSPAMWKELEVWLEKSQLLESTSKS